MFKKPFNKKVGETRKCKKCELEFHTLKPVWFCNPCLKDKAAETVRIKKENGTWKGIQKKENYPNGSDNERKAVWSKRQTLLKRMKQREEWKEYFRIRLEEVFNDRPLLEWINDRRDDATLRQNRTIRGKYKSKQDLPDTTMKYDEW